MSASFPAFASLPEACRFLLQIGFLILFQSTLLLLGALGLVFALRRAGSAARCVVLRSALVGMAVTAVLAVGYPSPHFWSLATLLESPSGAAAPAPVPAPPGLTPADVEPPRPPATPAPAQRVILRLTPAPPAASGSPQPVAIAPPVRPGGAASLEILWVAGAATWIGGAALLLAWLAVCYAGSRRLRRLCRPENAGPTASILRELCHRREVPLPELLVGDVRSPFVAGVRQPAVVIPESLTRVLAPAALRAVLAHEVAHLTRGDATWSFFSRVLRALFWPQLLLLPACRLLELAAEELCDQEALREGCPPAVYSRCLVQLAADTRPGWPERAMGTGAVSFGKELERRLHALYRPGGNGNAVAPNARGALVTTVCILVLAAGWLTPAIAELPAPLEPGAPPPLKQQALVHAEGVPVGDLLQLLTQKTGTKLSADPYVADDKVILMGPARALNEILGDLAELFNDRWERRVSPAGEVMYLLTRPLRARRYEDGLAEAAVERMLAELELQVQALGESPEQLARRPEGDRLRQLFSGEFAASDMGRRTRFATRVYALLAPAQRRALLEAWHLGVPLRSLPTTAQRQARDEFLRVAEEARQRGQFTPFPDGTQPPPTPEFLEGLKPEALDLAGLSFDVNSALGRNGEPKLSIEMKLAGLYPEMHLATFDLLPDSIPPSGNPYTGEKVAVDAPLLDAEKVASAISGGSWPDRLRLLSGSAKVPVVADYYRALSQTRPGYRALADGGADPHAAILDRFCLAYGSAWWLHGRTLLLRKRDWYRQRLAEIPDHWLLQSAERLEKQGFRPTVRDVTQCAALSRAQLSSLENLVEGYRDTDPHRWLGVRELLQLVQAGRAGLDRPLGPQTYLVSDENTLTFAKLSQAQRNLLPALIDAYPKAVRPDQVAWFAADLRAGAAVSPAPEAGGEGAPARAEVSLGMPQRTASGYRYVPVDVAWSFMRVEDTGPKEPGKPPTPLIQHGWNVQAGLSLPASLPDDRRDRTRVELNP